MKQLRKRTQTLIGKIGRLKYTAILWLIFGMGGHLSAETSTAIITVNFHLDTATLPNSCVGANPCTLRQALTLADSTPATPFASKIGFPKVRITTP